MHISLQEIHFARFARLIHFLIGKTDSLGLPACLRGGESDGDSFGSSVYFSSEYGSNSNAARVKPRAI
jgi:hypothetical protein